MTENKRFRDCEVLDNVIYVDDTIISEKRLLEVLNENEGLKTKLDYHQRMHEQYKRDSLAVVKENEQLKQQIKKLEAQLYKVEDGVCDICKNMYLVQQGRYLDYCDDFELKDGDVE